MLAIFFGHIKGESSLARLVKSIRRLRNTHGFGEFLGRLVTCGNSCALQAVSRRLWPVWLGHVAQCNDGATGRKAGEIAKGIDTLNCIAQYLPMQRFSDILAEWPSHAAIEDDLGVKRGLPAVWRHRDSVPPEYWLALVDAAQRRGIEGVTLEALARIASSNNRVDARVDAAPSQAAE